MKSEMQDASTSASRGLSAAWITQNTIDAERDYAERTKRMMMEKTRYMKNASKKIHRFTCENMHVAENKLQ
jgi:hypothetical protein